MQSSLRTSTRVMQTFEKKRSWGRQVSLRLFIQWEGGGGEGGWKKKEQGGLHRQTRNPRYGYSLAFSTSECASRIQESRVTLEFDLKLCIRTDSHETPLLRTLFVFFLKIRFSRRFFWGCSGRSSCDKLFQINFLFPSIRELVFASG